MLNFVKISKSKARKLFTSGEIVRITPSKISPYNVWGYCCDVSFEKKEPDRTFDAIVNAFEYYNCTSETGKRASFWMQQEVLEDNRR